MKNLRLHTDIIALILVVLASGILPRPTMAQSSLSLKQKVGQIFIFGYPSAELSPAAVRHLTRLQPGGLIAFGRHIRSPLQIGQLNQSLQSLSLKNGNVPFLLMVDQEGGTVSRIHISTPLPSALSLGRIDRTDLVERYGIFTGQLLRSLGFQMNLAPVLDLSDPNSKTFIGNRSFGVDAQEVTNMGLAYSRGLLAAGIVPTAKHFPGHGGVSQDSHKTTPRKLASLEELSLTDLKPFTEFQKIPGAKAVMLGHLSLPNADPSDLPAAFSPYVLGEILRTKIGFTGLAITDDVEMSGAGKMGTLGERVVAAFEAGNDMIMVAGSPRSQINAYEALLQAVETGRISEERLDESVNRILESKKNFSGFQFSPIEAQQKSVQLAALGEQIQFENFVLASSPYATLRGSYKLGQKYLVFSADRSFFNHFSAIIPKSSRFIQLTPSSLTTVPTLLERHPSALAVYYASGAQTARWLEQLPPSAKRRIIVVNTNNAAAIADQHLYRAVLNLSTLAPKSGEWLADYLTFKPQRRQTASF